MKYVIPEMEILKLDVYDVICVSGDGIIPGGDGDLEGSGGGADAPETPW